MSADEATDHPMADKLDDWARVACPRGHILLQDQDGEYVYCQSCNRCYDYDDLVDKRETTITERGW